MKRLLTLAPLLILCLLLLPVSAAQVQELSPEQAARAMAEISDLVVLDVRTPDEYNQGHIEGAVNIDFYAKDFQAQLGQLERDRPYLVYCRSGRRSGVATETMLKLGFTDIRHLRGGILAWNKAGLPLQR